MAYENELSGAAIGPQAQEQARHGVDGAVAVQDAELEAERQQRAAEMQERGVSCIMPIVQDGKSKGGQDLSEIQCIDSTIRPGMSEDGCAVIWKNNGEMSARQHAPYVQAPFSGEVVSVKDSELFEGAKQVSIYCQTGERGTDSSPIYGMVTIDGIDPGKENAILKEGDSVYAGQLLGRATAQPMPSQSVSADGEDLSLEQENGVVVTYLDEAGNARSPKVIFATIADANKEDYVDRATGKKLSDLEEYPNNNPEAMKTVGMGGSDEDEERKRSMSNGNFAGQDFWTEVLAFLGQMALAFAVKGATADAQKQAEMLADFSSGKPVDASWLREGSVMQLNEQGEAVWSWKDSEGAVVEAVLSKEQAEEILRIKGDSSMSEDAKRQAVSSMLSDIAVEAETEVAMDKGFSQGQAALTNVSEEQSQGIGR